MREYVRDELENVNSDLNAELEACGYIKPQGKSSVMHRYIHDFSNTPFGQGVNDVVAPLLNVMERKRPRDDAPEVRYVVHYLFKITVFIRGTASPLLSEESEPELEEREDDEEQQQQTPKALLTIKKEEYNDDE